MKLYDALRQLLGEYGKSVISEKRLTGLLSDLGAFDTPEVRKVMEAFSADGYGRELSTRHEGESRGDCLVHAESIKELLIRDHGFGKGGTDYAVDSVTFALGYRDFPPDVPLSGNDSEDEGSFTLRRLFSGEAERRTFWQHSWNETGAVERCRMAAEGGDSDAQYWLGVMYRYGRGVSQDYKEALRWFLKSAEQGDAYAGAELGDLYNKGLGTEQSRTSTGPRSGS